MQRWYQQAAVVLAPLGWQVQLDGKLLNTPAGTPLLLANALLAQAVAAEWQAAPKLIQPDFLPLTQLAMTQQDKIAPQRAVVIAGLCAFLPTELICFYSTTEAVIVQQRALWAPLHAWLAQCYGITLPVTMGLTGLSGVDSAWLQQALYTLTDAELTVCSAAADLLGSVIIPLALVRSAVDITTALAAAEVEMDYQAAKYGADEQLLNARAQKAAALNSFMQYLALTKNSREG